MMVVDRRVMTMVVVVMEMLRMLVAGFILGNLVVVTTTTATTGTSINHHQSSSGSIPFKAKNRQLLVSSSLAGTIHKRLPQQQQQQQQQQHHAENMGHPVLQTKRLHRATLNKQRQNRKKPYSQPVNNRKNQETTDNYFQYSTTTEACSLSQVTADTCVDRMDGYCDAGTILCDAGTDCFDCDPCGIYDNTDCNTCISALTLGNGDDDTTTTIACSWCVTGTGSGICRSSNVAEGLPYVCSADGIGTAYYDTCTYVPTIDVPTCSIYSDACPFDLDWECDADGATCPFNSDCFDCDPCIQFSTSCEECTVNMACTWCSDPTLTTGGICNSIDIATQFPDFCISDGGTAYSTICSTTNTLVPTPTIAMTTTTLSPSPIAISVPSIETLSPSPVAIAVPSIQTLSPSPVAIAVPSTVALSPSPVMISPPLSTPTSSSSTTCSVFTDTCTGSYQFDFECDADGTICAIGSDCFDCDPCQQYTLSGASCEDCIAAGCVYATIPSKLYPGTDLGICTAPDIAAAVPYIALQDGGTEFQSTCTGTNVNVGSSQCDFINDSCITQQNGVCEADGTSCPANSDCFDCDPCQVHTGCEECTSSTVVDSGCMWCTNVDGVTGQCSSVDAAKAFPYTCFLSPYSSTCDDVSGTSSPSTYTCDGTNDACSRSLDGICDAAGIYYTFCPYQSDCLDCDPCQTYRFDGCETCVSRGCEWCSAEAICRSPGTILPSTTKFNCPDFVTTCPAPDDGSSAPYTDPLYDSMMWLYEQINVLEVWQSGITGTGIGIRINDVGIDVSHPEFSDKFIKESSCELYTPYTLDEKHNHGTTCASLAAGSNNTVCSVGIAPDAMLSGCRAIYIEPDETLSPEAEDRSSRYLYENMETMHVSSNSYGFPSCQSVVGPTGRYLQTASCPFASGSDVSPCAVSDCAGVDWSDPSPYTFCRDYVAGYCQKEYELDVDTCTSFLDLFVKCEFGSQTAEEEGALRKGVTEGRNGKGIIYVFAAGNDYGRGSDVNYEGTLNSRYIISVGAVGKDSMHTSYSTGGAPLFVSAPGGDYESYTKNVVAAAGGGCTEGGVGTSFATPIVSGVVALILQTNPDLSWRDVQGVLASTSKMVDPFDSSWITNSAGFHHSYLYGFGMIDAAAAVSAARTWANFLEEQQFITESGSVNVAIPEFPSDPVESTVPVSAPASFVAESVSVYLDLVHSSRGDLEIVLISPTGTESILSPGERPENTQETQRWKLTTVRNWGEPVNGDWKLRIVDRSEGDVSSCVDVADWTVDLSSPGEEPLIWDCYLIALNEVCASGGEGPGFTTFFGLSATGISDPQFTNVNGTSLVEACCECGGSVLASTVVNALQSWTLAIYGHDGTSQSIPVPSDTTASTGSNPQPPSASVTNGGGGPVTAGSNPPSTAVANGDGVPTAPPPTTPGTAPHSGTHQFTYRTTTLFVGFMVVTAATFLFVHFYY